MTKIDIFSGFLGAGKTTLIKKLIEEAFKGEKVVLIENEFGEIGIDGGFLQDAGIEITEMNSGCICCSLVGDFTEALKKVLTEFAPDRILIEPSGVGKLSDVIRAVERAGAGNDEMKLNSFTTVADVNKCEMYLENFGEFYNDQISHAGCVVLSHTTGASDETVSACVEKLKALNSEAVIITTPWEKLDGKQMLEAMERTDSLENALKHLEEEEEDVCPVCGHHHEHGEHHHHDHEHDHEHEHEHDHDHEHEHEHDHEHEHEHEHDHEHEHEHEHEHDHDEHGHHHHHHHADDVFTSWGKETTKKFTADGIKSILNALSDKDSYGMVLRAKGIVEAEDGSWIHFDYIPGEPDVRPGHAGVIGRLCVIGSKINEDKLAELFGL